mmetsp:Transcript_22807/g.34549  ORF Transcript_22807/g.34549 Transcript_22807/m.34549 type:complete len:105 (+) Transcript_22807:1448-1762(+)
MIFISGFFAALRGKEIVRVDLGTIKKHWDESVNFLWVPRVPLMLLGRFKRETGKKLFCQPLAIKSKLGLDIKTRFFCTVWAMEKLVVTNGPLFRATGAKKSGVK